MENALFNLDQVMHGDGLVIGRSRGRGSYLERSSSLIFNWMENGWVRFGRSRKSGIAKTDRHIRLCLARGGDVICLREVVSGGGNRRRGYIYYTEDFAELQMGPAIRQDVQAPCNTGGVLQTFLIGGCESAFLLPSMRDTSLFTMDDIVANSSARLFRDR